MFEDSLMESQGRLGTPAQRWTTVASLTLQCAVAAALIALPLVHPEVLPFRSNAPTVNLPLKPVPPRVPHVETKTSAGPAPSQPSTQSMGHPRIDFQHLQQSNANSEDAPPTTSLTGRMGSPDGLPDLVSHADSITDKRVRIISSSTRMKGPLHVSTGVSNGLLLEPIRPVYPRIAVSTHTEGVVIVEAIISKTGRIESVRATSGPELLRGAAIDAVRSARYSPYLLNGLPTEVETTITVTFRLAA